MGAGLSELSSFAGTPLPDTQLQPEAGSPAALSAALPPQLTTRRQAPRSDTQPHVASTPPTAPNRGLDARGVCSALMKAVGRQL